MHSSRQALLGGNTSTTSNNSYDPPPHLRPQNNGFRQPSSGSGYGSFGPSRNGGDGTLGSSTNTIPLVGRGRWGQAKAANQNNVSFADQDQKWGKNSEVKQSPARQGWGERSAGAVGWGVDPEVKAKSDRNGESTGGDIWGTIPVEKEADDDMSWRKPVEQDNIWGQGKQVKTSMPAGGWGQTSTPKVEEQQQASSGWDVPAPQLPGQPRSNASSSRQPSPKDQQPSPQPSFQPQPRHQAPALQPSSQRPQVFHNQAQPEDPYVAPIRSESSGWYDYATPAPQYSGLPMQNRAIPGIAAGWGSAATSVGATSVPATRGNKAVEIKDPNRPSSAFAGWDAAPPPQSHPHSQSQPQYQRPLHGQEQDQEIKPEPDASEWDTTETKIQRWTRSVDQASQAGGSDEVDGMDISRSDAGWGPGEDEEAQKVDRNSGEKVVERWGASSEEKVERDDGWGPGSGKEEQADDGWGKPVESHDDGGWGKAASNQEGSGWGQPATAPQSTGWVSPTPASQRSAVENWETSTYPTRSPMDERQPLGPAAKGLIQRHLGGSGAVGSSARPGVGGRKKPELPPPKSNPFDIAAGDIWSSLPAIDDDEVIRPPSDSESESESSSDIGSEPESPTHKRPGNMLGISRASLLPVIAKEDDDIKSTAATANDTPSRMSIASTDENGSITVHPGGEAGYEAQSFIETPKKKATQNQWSAPPADMLIDFDTPEESFSPPKQQPRALYESISPGSMMTRSSTLIDMDDMLELKTPVTSPDRKWIGLDDPKDLEGLGHLYQGRSFQNAMDPGLAMFEGAYLRRN